MERQVNNNHPLYQLFQDAEFRTALHHWSRSSAISRIMAVTGVTHEAAVDFFKALNMANSCSNLTILDGLRALHPSDFRVLIPVYINNAFDRGDIVAPADRAHLAAAICNLGEALPISPGESMLLAKYAYLGEIFSSVSFLEQVRYGRPQLVTYLTEALDLPAEVMARFSNTLKNLQGSPNTYGWSNIAALLKNAVKMKTYHTQKINFIKEVRALAQLGLRDAKELTEGLIDVVTYLNLPPVKTPSTPTINYELRLAHLRKILDHVQHTDVSRFMLELWDAAA